MTGFCDAKTRLETFTSFDFVNGQIQNGFDNWIYSDIGTNICGVYNGKEQSKLCGKDKRGKQLSLYLYYNKYNNDHMGWTRWGYIDANKEICIKGGALKVVLTGGAYNKRGRVGTKGRPITSKTQWKEMIDKGLNVYAETPVPGGLSIYMRNQNSTTTFANFQGKNRLSMWVLMPVSPSKSFNKQRYSLNYRRPDYTFEFYPFIDDSRRGHYYHSLANIPLGGWTHFVFDAHPVHHNSGDKNPYSYYRSGGREAPGRSVDYFNRIVSFSLVGANTKHQPSPTNIYFDEIESYFVEHENDETIAGLGVGFSPDTKQFDISFADKYRGRGCRSSYEVRYSFEPVTNENYKDSRLCRVTNFLRKQNNDKGLIYKPAEGYNQIWAGIRLRPSDEKKLNEGTTIYFALKDMSDRSELGARDKFDLETVHVPGLGMVRRIDLIKTIDYKIYPVNWPLEIKCPGEITVKEGEPFNLQIKSVGGKKPYSYSWNHKNLESLFLSSEGRLTGKVEHAETQAHKINSTDAKGQTVFKNLRINIVPHEDCTDEIDNDKDGQTDCNDSECYENSRCGDVLVDFGNGPEKNVYGLNWETVIKDKYTRYTEEGTTIGVGKNGSYDYQGVTGSGQDIVKGQKIIVWWVNKDEQDAAFIPYISFTDINRREPKSQEWYPMTKVKVKPNEKGYSVYTVSEQTKGFRNTVNVNINYNNNHQIVCDRILLVH